MECAKDNKKAANLGVLKKDKIRGYGAQQGGERGSRG